MSTAGISFKIMVACWGGVKLQTPESPDEGSKVDILEENISNVKAVSGR